MDNNRPRDGDDGEDKTEGNWRGGGGQLPPMRDDGRGGGGGRDDRGGGGGFDRGGDRGKQNLSSYLILNLLTNSLFNTSYLFRF